VAGGFSALSAQLIEHGTAGGVLKLVSPAVRDEVHHPEIAVEMAARLPVCCINETLACGILEEPLSIATSPLTRAALQEIVATALEDVVFAGSARAGIDLSKARE
jgi:hypothetical protein